ncbi:hypothetical protein JW979_11000 [bacterium]|nr:hypothetical protein [candidate division CSSED10-310 bacterium]
MRYLRIMLFLFVFSIGTSYASDSMLYMGMMNTPESDPVADGSYDMVFQFYNAEMDGTLLLTDAHTGSDAVPVVQGRFTVFLGSGILTPGVESDLETLFANHDTVYMEVQIDSEPVLPRQRITSAGFAIDTRFLDGKGVSEFGDTHSLDAADGDPTDAVYVNGLGQMGIGSSSPDKALLVQETGSGGVLIDTPVTATGHLIFQRNGSPMWTVQHYPDRTFHLGEAGNPSIMSFLENGDVGLSIANPSWDLDLVGDLYIHGGIYDTAGNIGISEQYLFSSGSGTAWNDFVDSDWVISGEDIYATSFDSYGIGTNVPLNLLKVNGPESDTPGIGHLFRIQDSSNSNMAFGFRIGSLGANDLFLDRYWGGWQSSLAIMRNTGNVGIGTDSPVNRLDVAGNAVIGPDYAGFVTAPVNGLLIQGQVGIGRSDASHALHVSGGYMGIPGNRKLVFDDNFSPVDLQVAFDTGIGFGFLNNTMTYAASIHSWRDDTGANEYMQLDTGSNGGFYVYGTGDSSFSGKLGLGIPAVNMLDIWGGMTMGTGFAGAVSAPTDGMLIQGSVGVNTATVTQKLTIMDDSSAGGIGIFNSSGENLLFSGVSSSNYGFLQTYGPNGNLNAFVSVGDNDNCGGIAVCDNTGSQLVSMYTSSENTGAVATFDSSGTINSYFGNLTGYENDGYIGVAGADSSFVAGMYNNPGETAGVVFGDVKNFRMDYPGNPDLEIWYSCVEGPEAASYIRGTARLTDGEAVISLPEHFQDMVNPAALTVQLTPLSADSQGLTVTYKSKQKIVVRELQYGTGTYDFDWRISGVRQGFEDFKVIRPRSSSEPAIQKGFSLKVQSLK